MAYQNRRINSAFWSRADVDVIVDGICISCTVLEVEERLADLSTVIRLHTTSNQARDILTVKNTVPIIINGLSVTGCVSSIQVTKDSSIIAYEFWIVVNGISGMVQNPSENIEEIEETGENVKTKNVAALLMDNCKTIGVKFSGTEQLYTYKTVDDFEEGDHCVVLCENGSYQVARVDRVDKVPQIDVDSTYGYKWIVCRVEKQKYKQLMEAEEQFSQVLLEEQQRNVKQNAQKMLEEHLGIENDSLTNAIEDLNKGA